jgi:hypothetical protein
MKKKGQLAVETLLIYGVAILIVMLVVGALIMYLGNVGDLLPDQCQLADFTCENYQVSPTQVQLELRNNIGKNIDGISIAIIGEGDNEGLWQNCNFILPDPDTGVTIFVAQGDLTNPPLNMTCTIKVPPGKKIQGVIYANVSLVGSNIQRPIKGSIRATVS